MRYPNPRNRLRGLHDADQANVITGMQADGLTMNANLRYLPKRAFPTFVGQLDQIRQNQQHYRCKVWCAPFDFQTAIVAFGNFNATQNVFPGTCVWGLSFAALDGVASDFEIQIYDTCSGLAYFSEPVQGDLLRPDGTTDLVPVIIEPRYVTGNPHPALRINITNKAAVDQRCQLTIITAEPCEVMGPGTESLPKLPWQARGGVT